MNEQQKIVNKLMEVKSTIQTVENATFILENRVAVEDDPDIIESLKRMIYLLNSESLALLHKTVDELNKIVEK